jgi:transposase
VKSSESVTQLASYDIDHLGIVAGIIDEIGLVEEINEILGTHEQEVMSSGTTVKAMILNALGFVSAPLYLFQEFFVGKATELLLGQGIKPEHLHDDKLGKVLDKLFEADLTRLFVRVALKAAEHFGIDRRVVHLDSSSFHVHGQYAPEPRRDQRSAEAKPYEAIENEEMPSITITYGYSREQRPDLKQFVVDLMSTSDADVPLYFRAADGNEADKAVFADLIKDFKQQVDIDALFVADSALFSKENLKSLSGLSWLTRVPQTLKEAKRLLSELDEDDFKASSISGYRIAERQVTYGGILQRWLVIASDDAQTRAGKQQGKTLGKQRRDHAKALRALSRRSFHCQEDAEQAAETFKKTLTLHRLEDISIMSEKRYLKRGRPTANTPFELLYRIQARLLRDEAAIKDKQTRSGRFILASNVLDPERFSNDQLLAEYKAQQSAERGFRFLRDPLFFTSSVFLNTPSRVAALALIMALSLLVYTLGQRLLRQNLAAENATIRHQTGKATSTPTLRWVFQMFQAVHLIVLKGVTHISNLTKERQRILSFLCPSCQKYYLLI